MNMREFLNPDAWMEKGLGPRYVQLGRRLQDGIVSGLLEPGRPLPPEREIAQITDLSRVTVRKAIQTLVERGSIVQKQGSGSFVAPKTPRMDQSLSRLTSFSEDMERRGMKAESIWLERGVFMPSPDDVMSLGLEPEDSVSRLSRLRLADGRPLAIERASLPTSLLPDPLAVETSLYDRLHQSGHRPVRAIQKISAIVMEGRDAELLKVEAGVPGLRIERMSFLASGRKVEVTRSVYRGDAYNFVAELRLSNDQEHAHDAD